MNLLPLETEHEGQPFRTQLDERFGGGQGGFNLRLISRFSTFEKGSRHVWVLQLCLAHQLSAAKIPV